MDDFPTEQELEDLAIKAGAVSDPSQDDLEDSLLLHSRLKGDRGYRNALRAAAETLHRMLLQADPDLCTRHASREPQVNALEFLLHSLAFAASRPQAKDGSYLRYVALPLKHENFSPGAEYEHLSKTHFPKMVRTLGRFDPDGHGHPWLHLAPAYKNRETGEGRRTRGRATAPFLDWMVQQGLVFPWHPKRKRADRQASKASTSLIWASRKDGEDAYDEEGSAVPASPVLRPLQGDELILPALNEALHAQKVASPLSSYAEYKRLYQYRSLAPRKDGKPRKGGTTKNALGGDRWLFRQFSKEDGRAGRLYGHWVQSLPSEYRRKLTINGKSTVELDYVAMQLVLLYALADVPVPAGEDLYALSGMPQSQIDPSSRREDMKLILTRSVGNATREATIRSVQHAWRQEGRTKVSHAAERYDTFWSFHSAVCPHGPGITEAVWPQLQHLDSQIALRVLRKLLDQGITAIPIHDSFIVQDRYEAELKATMEESSEEVTGVRFRVKRA